MQTLVGVWWSGLLRGGGAAGACPANGGFCVLYPVGGWEDLFFYLLAGLVELGWACTRIILDWGLMWASVAPLGIVPLVPARGLVLGSMSW